MSISTEPLLERVAKLEALNRHLTFRLARLAKLLESEGTQRLERGDVNLTAYRMMLVISVFEEISVSDLARIMLIDRAQISRTATDLIARDLLENRADQASRRKKLLALTSAGATHYQELRASFDERERALTDIIGDDLSTLWQVLNRVDAWLETASSGGPGS